MKRRDFIKGLLSLPFVGYVASKFDDSIPLFSQKHPQGEMLWPGLDKKFYGDGVTLFDQDHTKDQGTVRSLNAKELVRQLRRTQSQRASEIFNNAFSERS